MMLQNFKNYLANRPYIEEDYSDESLQNVLLFSKNILTLFYNIDEEFINSEEFEIPLYEEAIYLLQNDPTTHFLTKYEGLSQFSIAGAITATVAQEYLPYLSQLAKLYLEKSGYLPVFSDSSKIKYGYTMF